MDWYDIGGIRGRGRHNKDIRGVDRSKDWGIENVPSEATIVGLNKASLIISIHTYPPSLVSSPSGRRLRRDSRIKRLPSTNIHNHQTPHFPIPKSLFQMSPPKFNFSSRTLFPLQPGQDEFALEGSEEFSLIGPILHHPE
jgi:hypothetical protein